jgi:hypothetical protein
MFDQHQSLKLKFLHCHSSYLIGEQGNIAPPLIFSPFVLGENKKTRKEKIHAKFFSPFPPHVWLSHGHYHVQVIGA